MTLTVIIWNDGFILISTPFFQTFSWLFPEFQHFLTHIKIYWLCPDFLRFSLFPDLRDPWECLKIHVAQLRPREKGGHFPDGIFKCISWMKMYEFWFKISLKFVLKGSINNIAALVQIMACRLVGAKPISEPMLVSLLTYIWVTQPQWINGFSYLAQGAGSGHQMAEVELFLCLQQQRRHSLWKNNQW